MASRITDVTIFHGYGVGPENMWFPWLHADLEKRGLAVSVPRLPDPLRPNYEKWMAVGRPYARRWTRNSLVIAHSLGGALAVRLLEKEARHRVAGVVLISPLFSSTINVEPLVRFFARPIDWWHLRDVGRKYHVLQAKDDPLVPCDHAFRYAEALGAELTLKKTGGHFTKKTCPPLAEILRPMLPRG
jgi:predicted alpha/beta hydrolase family esterase